MFAAHTRTGLFERRCRSVRNWVSWLNGGVCRLVVRFCRFVMGRPPARLRVFSPPGVVLNFCHLYAPASQAGARRIEIANSRQYSSHPMRRVCAPHTQHLGRPSSGEREQERRKLCAKALVLRVCFARLSTFIIATGCQLRPRSHCARHLLQCCRSAPAAARQTRVWHALTHSSCMQ